MAQTEQLTVDSTAISGVDDRSQEQPRTQEHSLHAGPAAQPRSEAMSEGELQSAYDGSNILFRVLLMHGWGQLLNFGYFDLLSPFSLFSLPVAQRKLVRKSVQLLRLEPEDSVLDVACGRGWSSHYIASSQPVSRVVGVDFLENHVRVCQTLHENLPRLEYRQGDATSLEFADESFNAVVCIEAAFHFDRKKFIAEAARVLKKGGRLVIVDFMWTRRPEPSHLKHPHVGAVRSAWSWNDFDSVDEYRNHALSAGLRVQSMKDWSFRVTAVMHALFHTLAAVGRTGVGRSLLSRVNHELRSVGPSDWRELGELVGAHDYVRKLSRYVAITLVKD